MIKIEYSTHFQAERKKFVRNNRKRFNDYAKTLRLFVSDPSHPSLNMEKLKGGNIYTLRLNKGDRIFFIWKNKTTVLFTDIGKHDKYKDY
ncbi:MAG: hypothetical protein HYW86_02035 [Candidatus Roizmanbacteria bacterium]|nr:MAG: hypothetical protein HYW86_02035 [Candidatus Roizmanbacteria bacterium]